MRTQGEIETVPAASFRCSANFTTSCKSFLWSSLKWLTKAWYHAGSRVSQATIKMQIKMFLIIKRTNTLLSWFPPTEKRLQNCAYLSENSRIFDIRPRSIPRCPTGCCSFQEQSLLLRPRNHCHYLLRLPISYKTNTNWCFLKLILCSGFKIVSPELETFYRYTLIFLLQFLMITNKD